MECFDFFRFLLVAPRGIDFFRDILKLLFQRFLVSIVDVRIH